MTTYSTTAGGLSYEELSQKVIALGGFVERIPGLDLLRDARPFIEKGAEQPNDASDLLAMASDTQNSYDQGFADGYSKAEAAMRAELTAMQQLLVEADALQVEPTAEIVQMICELVERLVIPVCEKMPVTRQWLLNQIDRALPHIAECTEAQTLWLNPDDAKLLENLDLPLEIQIDPMMPRATLQIRSSTGYLETGISPFIQQMRDALDLSEVE